MDGTQDTERPPALFNENRSGAPGHENRSEAPGGTADARPSAPPSPGEATTVGPPPDPARTMAERVGPPTPRALRAAAPASPHMGPLRPPTSPKLVAAPPAPGVASAPDGSPKPPVATVAAGRAAPPPHATSLGLAPPPTSAPRLASVPSIAAGAALTRTCAKCGELYPADFLVCPRDATPLTVIEATTADDPLVGQLIDDTYRIVRLVGEGGMGRVYEARHLRLKERRFAVKCLHADLARNAEMAARFLREAESASSIKHEHVIDVFDVHHLPDGTPYLVGEFLEGEELAEYVTKRGPLEPRMAAKVARQVCSALAAAHARGIVHRDMKPENVFVLAASIAAVERGESRTLRIKVLDFGISTAGPEDQSHLTRTGVIMGTPSYMAPEQARGRPVDHRADVYSLGACLYFMVTGRRPFDSDDPSSTLTLVLTEDPVRPRTIDPSIPELLELVIQRAMAKDANERYASMADVDKALATFLGSASQAAATGLSAVPPSSSEQPAGRPGTARAIQLAKAVFGSSLASPAQQTTLAPYARSVIVVTSAALGAWLVSGTVAALAGLVRVLHDGEITLTESVLLVVACAFAAATPIALYVVNLRKVIWPNSVRAVQLAVDLRRMMLGALVTYGALAMFVRIAHTVVLRSSRGVGSGLWDIVLFLSSVAAAVAFGNFRRIVKNLRRGRLD